jgi:transposase-like protein
MPAKKYSPQFKRRVIDEIDAKQLSVEAASKHFGVNKVTIYAWTNKKGRAHLQHLATAAKGHVAAAREASFREAAEPLPPVVRAQDNRDATIARLERENAVLRRLVVDLQELSGLSRE